MSDDFETVWRALRFAEDRDKEPLEALERIEAEVERLTADLDAEIHTSSRLLVERRKAEAEVERLTAVEKTLDENVAYLKNENSRLTQTLGDANRGIVGQLRASRAEVERLRADNVKLAQGILPAGAVVTFEEKE